LGEGRQQSRRKIKEPSLVTNHRTILGKALKSREPQIYGTFAEIGAGQEVPDIFSMRQGLANRRQDYFRLRYDLFRRNLWQRIQRPLCRESRLLKMLDKEFGLLNKRLNLPVASKPLSLPFANTVAPRPKQTPTPRLDGCSLSSASRGPVNDIVVHVRMNDRYRLLQQEALGILGVNLVSAAFKSSRASAPSSPICREPERRPSHYRHDSRHRPDVTYLDTQLLNLELVRRGLAVAVLFSPEGDILTVSDTVYGRPIIVERGSFRPVTISRIFRFSFGVPGQLDPRA